MMQLFGKTIWGTDPIPPLRTEVERRLEELERDHLIKHLESIDQNGQIFAAAAKIEHLRKYLADKPVPQKDLKIEIRNVFNRRDLPGDLKP